MKLRLASLAVAALLVIGGAVWMRGLSPRPHPKAVPAPREQPSDGKRTPAAWVAAPGRVEPISEEMRLGFPIAGRIREVLAEEGDRVRRGQVLARLDAEDLIARVEAAEQTLAGREATLAKVLAGARDMRTKDAVSPLATSQVAISLAAFFIVYILLAVLDIFLLARYARKDPA